jgi:hypothetical protein
VDKWTAAEQARRADRLEFTCRSRTSLGRRLTRKPFGHQSAKEETMKHVATVLLVLVVGAASVSAQPPGGVEITCDVDRPTFRSLARSQTQVTFRLWDSASGGAQCGPDYTLPVDDLVVFKRHGDRVRTADPVALQRRKVLRISAVLGSDASPVQLCSGPETWLDVVAGTTTLTCDFSAQMPQARRRLQSVPFAQQGQSADISTRVCRTGVLTVADSTNTAVPFDAERWDTDDIHAAGDPTKLTAQTSGKYLIFGHIAWVGTATGRRQVAIYKNSDPIAIQNEPGSATHFSISTHHELLQGEFVELFVLQDSGGPNDISAGCHPTQNFADDFGMVKLP